MVKATGTSKPSSEIWSHAAKPYSALIDTSDALNPAGAACKQILDVVDATLPFDHASYIIDVDTGRGPVISGVLDSSPHALRIPSQARIVAADVAQGLLDLLAQGKADREQKAWKRLEIRQWDAIDLRDEVVDDAVSHLLSPYAYFAMADERAAQTEAHRILQPGGLFFETSMGYTEWGHLAQFFQTVLPETKIPGPGDHWQSVDGVNATLLAVGFTNVQTKAFDIGIPCHTPSLSGVSLGCRVHC